MNTADFRSVNRFRNYQSPKQFACQHCHSTPQAVCFSPRSLLDLKESETSQESQTYPADNSICNHNYCDEMKVDGKIHRTLSGQRANREARHNCRPLRVIIQPMWLVNVALEKRSFFSEKGIGALSQWVQLPMTREHSCAASAKACAGHFSIKEA
jgi:hypothetical protein